VVIGCRVFTVFFLIFLKVNRVFCNFLPCFRLSLQVISCIYQQPLVRELIWNLFTRFRGIFDQLHIYTITRYKCFKWQMFQHLHHGGISRSRTWLPMARVLYPGSVAEKEALRTQFSVCSKLPNLTSLKTLQYIVRALAKYITAINQDTFDPYENPHAYTSEDRLHRHQASFHKTIFQQH